jgi:hypothetical protein
MKWVLLLLAGALPSVGQCTYSVSPSTLSVPANGGGGAVNVSTLSACAWSFSTDSPSWISLSVPGATNNSVSGSGAVTVTALASSLPTARTGNVIIQGGGTSTAVTVTQGAAQCSMTLLPSAAALLSAGGPGSFAVQTACSWSAISITPWITVTPSGGSSSVASGTGNGTVSYTAAPNSCVDPQSGTIVVTGQPNQTF